MAVIFLDQDDEITTAIARLKASEDIKVALVLPPGSRLGTSRINFRLLAREAQSLPRQATIVTADSGVRAIAVSAGLPAYGSVAEYEAAISAPKIADDDGALRAGAVGAAGAVLAAPAGEDAVPADAVPHGSTADAGVPPALEADLVLDPGAGVHEAAGTASAAGLVGTTAQDHASAADTGDTTDEPGRAPTDAPAAPVDADTPATDATVVKGRSRKRKAAAAGEGVAAGAAASAGATGVLADAASLAAGPATEATSAPVDPAAATVVVPAATAASAAIEQGTVAAPAAPRGPAPRSSGALPVVGGPVSPTSLLSGRGGLLGIAAIVGVLVIVGLAAAVLVLPQATITVAPPIETVGPVTLTVRADTEAIEPDLAAGIIPAERIVIPLSADGEFTATGVRVTEKAARGSVAFSNSDTSASNVVPAGSIVATSDGVRFRTMSTIEVPRAKLNPTFRPGVASVRVEAVKAGPNANVKAGEITRVPSGEDARLLSVTNPNATSGGERTETTRIAQSDVDGALADLRRQLDDQLAAALADPATTPEGMTLIPETAAMGAARARPAPDNLVGRNVTSFDLALTASGDVIAVDTGVLEPLAAQALTDTVPEGAVLFPESVATTAGSPTVADGVVSFELGASGQAWRPPDAEELLAAVRGRSVPEAEAALADYGDVVIDVWPFYVATIPDNDRASLTIVPPTPSPQ